MHAEGTSIRVAAGFRYLKLSWADRVLIRDLAVVQLISTELAEQYHYANADAKRALSRLSRGGLLRSGRLYVAGAKPARVYQFASRAIAAAWGGRLPPLGGGRTALHELLVARAYFALQRPADYRVATCIADAGRMLGDACRPDAVFTNAATGELVLVEADSGQYTVRQIREKMVRWRSLGLSEQVWVQPLGVRAARVPDVSGVRVLRL